jgi:hypothetical protein
MYKELSDELAKHERERVQYMTPEGNFKSDFYRIEYENGKRKLERRIKEQRRENNDKSSFYDNTVQFAQRDR